MSDPARTGPPRSGEVLKLDRRASVQFGGDRAIFFRVIRVMDGPCTLGWLWIDGFELGQNGDAVERRQVFVQVAGLVRVDWERLRAAQALRRAALRRNAGGVGLPRQVRERAG